MASHPFSVGTPGLLPPLTYWALSQRKAGPCWCWAGACQPVSAQPPGGALRKGLAPWTPLMHSLHSPFSCPHCSSNKGVFLHLLHCHLCHLPWRVLWEGRRGTILGDLGSPGRDGSGQNLGIIKVLLSKIKTHCLLLSSLPLSGEGVWGTPVLLRSPLSNSPV